MQPDRITRGPGRPPTPLIDIVCEACGTTFAAKPWVIAGNRGRFCSPACFGAYRKRRVVRPCAQCGALVETIPSRVEQGKGRYCSKSCRDLAQTSDLYERFAAYTDRSSPNGCWPWIGNIKRRTGYGHLTIGDRVKSAHTTAWVLVTGLPIPRGRIIGHTCDVRHCVRNNDTGTYTVQGIEYERRGHLWLATHKANMADMAEKGRAASGGRHNSQLHPESVAKGERNGWAKLTDGMVITIRRRYAAGGISQQVLADEYHVLQTTISKIVLEKSWRHLQ